MLRTMRNDFKKYSWTLWLVIIAFFGGFVLTDAFSGGGREKNGLVYIGDELIVNKEEFRVKLMRTLDNYKNRFKENFSKSMISQLRLPEQLLQNYINNAVIKKEAGKFNIAATDEELKDKIINHPWFQQDGKFVGLQNYERFLGYYYKMTVPEFEDQLKDEVVFDKFRELVTGALVIGDETLREEYRKEKDNAELDLITLKPARIKETIHIEDNDGALSEYYEKHKEDFKTRERRAGHVIAFKFTDHKKEVSVTPKKIYELYMKSKADFITPGKTRASRILLKYDDDKKNREEVSKNAYALQRELTKENFAEKAKAFSQDDKAKQGGDHGYMGWKSFTSQERSMIEGMEQQQISSPIDTQKGFSIVYITEKVAQKQQTFDEVKDRLKDTLERETLEQLVTQKLQKIYDRLGKVENIKAKAAEMGVTAIETELLTNGSPVKDIDQGGYISRQLFTLKEKELAFPVKLMDGIAIVQLAKIEEPAVEPFENVKEKVKGKVLLAKKIQRLKEEAKKISLELKGMNFKDQKELETYLAKKDLSSETVTYKRGNKLSRFPVKKDLDEMIFALEENQISPLIEFETELALVRVKSKTVTGTSDFEKEKTDFYNQKIDGLKNRYFTSYMSNKMKTYQVSMNEKVFQEIKDWVMARYN